MATYKSIKYAFSGSEITDVLANPAVQSISPASLSEENLGMFRFKELLQVKKIMF